MSKAYSLLPEGMQFSEYYAQFFVIVVVRELGPLLSGLILIARSANAITFEIGHLKLHNQFEALKAQGMDPIFVFLLPVLFAFPLSLMAMIVVFVTMCIFSSYVFIQVSYQPDLHLGQFIGMILAQISSLEILISLLKCYVGGTFIGLLCIYFGGQVGNKFTDISRAISSATSWQFLLFFATNVGLSVVGYL
jgi:phospholipid/cholesterol/gamma-HCH transport system permease protein